MLYRLLFLPFFIVPLIEVWILVKVGRVIGAPPLIGLILLTAIIGVYFLRQQGLSTFLRAQRSLAEGQVPALELLEGGMLLVAGALLLTPGFATDALGFGLLFPVARKWLARRLFSWLGLRMVVSPRSWESPDRDPETRSFYSSRDRFEELKRHNHEPQPSQTIEGEFTREDDS